ncbi:MAG: LAGLIDADG family homing endonuclease [archaeon]
MKRYTLKEYDLAIFLAKQGFGSLRISKIISIPKGTIEYWINRGGKPYDYSESRIKAINSKENIKRLRKVSKYSQPLAVEKAQKINTKKLQTSSFILSENLGYVLGVIFGDGHTSEKSRRIILAAIDKDFVLEFKNNLEKWSGFESRIFLRVIPTDNIIKNRLPQWTCYLDTIEGAKFISTFDLDSLLDTTNKIKCSFLKGLYDSEGSISKDGIIFYNSDKKLIYLIKNLLNSLGIFPTLNVYEAKSLSGKLIKYYHLSIYRKEYLKKYQNLIGFSIGRKSKTLKSLIKNSYSNTEVLVKMEENTKQQANTDNDHTIFVGSKPFN